MEQMILGPVVSGVKQCMLTVKQICVLGVKGAGGLWLESHIMLPEGR